jgi:hypothetical protein
VCAHCVFNFRELPYNLIRKCAYKNNSKISEHVEGLPPHTTTNSIILVSMLAENKIK